jgi:excinuclease ABC subunit C
VLLFGIFIILTLKNPGRDGVFPLKVTLEEYMRAPVTAGPSELESIPDVPAVFLLWASEGKPYLARTALLRRRLKRLISDRERLTKVLNLRGIVERIEYWPMGSGLESSLLHLEIAQKYFPEDWPRITRLRPPAFVRLTIDNPFPRTMITSRIGKGLFYGPFASRAAAERFDGEMLDLFQIRRCEENLTPSPEHPGCIYGEMARCLRPCQAVVSIDEYRSEAGRVEQFLRTNGASLKETAEASRDRASVEMQFEAAERLHQRVEKIEAVQALGGELARAIDLLNGVAVVRAPDIEAVDLMFLLGGCWQEPVRFSLGGKMEAGESMDRRLRELTQALPAGGPPNMEHLAILTRWHGSSWRDGEWLGFDTVGKISYRKLVNAIGRVHGLKT